MSIAISYPPLGLVRHHGQTLEHLYWTLMKQNRSDPKTEHIIPYHSRKWSLQFQHPSVHYRFDICRWWTGRLLKKSRGMPVCGFANIQVIMRSFTYSYYWPAAMSKLTYVIAGIYLWVCVLLNSSASSFKADCKIWSPIAGSILFPLILNGVSCKENDDSTGQW